MKLQKSDFISKEEMQQIERKYWKEQDERGMGGSEAVFTMFDIFYPSIGADPVYKVFGRGRLRQLNNMAEKERKSGNGEYRKDGFLFEVVFPMIGDTQRVLTFRFI